MVEYGVCKTHMYATAQEGINYLPKYGYEVDDDIFTDPENKPSGINDTY